MAFENILVVDDNLTVVESTEMLLADSGFRVTTATNGLAAITHPDIEDVDLILLDSNLAGEQADDICKMLKTNKKTFEVPILLLIDEEEVYDRYSPFLAGGDGYVLKPFTQEDLISKINQILEEKYIKKRAEVYLREAAEQHIQSIAEEIIQKAVEKRTRIIAEKSLQQIVKIVSQRAEEEVNKQITSLSEQKEQQLIRVTVQEVARSMIEKMVDRRIVEQMDKILAENTEKAVQNTAQMIIPELAHEKVREYTVEVLPLEVKTKIEEMAQEVIPDVGNKLVGIVEEVADKSVAKIADVKLPPLAQIAVQNTVSQILPTESKIIVEKHMSDMMTSHFSPVFRKKMMLFTIINILILLVCIALLLGAEFLLKGGIESILELIQS